VAIQTPHAITLLLSGMAGGRLQVSQPHITGCGTTLQVFNTKMHSPTSYEIVAGWRTAAHGPQYCPGCTLAVGWELISL
jgi:hypothetical protein